MKKAVCLIFCLVLISNLTPVRAYDISAKAAVVINGETGEILYSLNCNERLPMASTTKIMTALLLCELCGDLTKGVTATREAVTVEGSSMGLEAGDTVSYHDLLYGMMLSSGNDAANTAAISLAGSLNSFADIMNERAESMGLKDTHFVTPSGLDAEGHYTTAYELALIAKTALQNPDFANAASAETARLKYGNPPYLRTLTNHNKLLKANDNIVGVKTGYTKKAGRCLVSASKKDGKFVIAVTLNDRNDWADHRYLLDLGLSLVTAKQFSYPNGKIEFMCANGDILQAGVPSASVCVSQNSKITYVIKAPRILYLPISKNQKLGEICYYSGEDLICSKDILANENKEYKSNKYILFFEIFKQILSSV